MRDAEIYKNRFNLAHFLLILNGKGESIDEFSLKIKILANQSTQYTQ